MKFTNNHGLPRAFVNAIAGDKYTRGDADISVTELIDSPRIRILSRTFGENVTEDVSARALTLLGQGVHAKLEDANKEGIAEKRFYVEIGGWRLSGGIDLIEDGILYDYKVTNVAGYQTEGRSGSWEKQTNCYAEMARENGVEVREIRIVVILRDFYMSRVGKELNYPDAPAFTVPVRMWTREQAQKYIRERIILHKQAEASVPVCTPEERWVAPTKWAVMSRTSTRRSLRNYDSEADAKSHASADPKKFYVEQRPGGAVRCRMYCSMNKFCSQYLHEQAQAAEVSQKEEIADEVS